MDLAKIQDSIERALEQNDYEDAARRHDIAFHLTDWLEDLQEWAAYCERPEDFDADATVRIMTAFLIHVPNHLAAASKLMLDIPVGDVFAVGAIEANA